MHWYLAPCNGFLSKFWILSQTKTSKSIRVMTRKMQFETESYTSLGSLANNTFVLNYTNAISSTVPLEVQFWTGFPIILYRNIIETAKKSFSIYWPIGCNTYNENLWSERAQRQSPHHVISPVAAGRSSSQGQAWNEWRRCEGYYYPHTHTSHVRVASIIPNAAPAKGRCQKKSPFFFRTLS